MHSQLFLIGIIHLNHHDLLRAPSSPLNLPNQHSHQIFLSMSTLHSQHFDRRSIRLQGYDYTQEGCYFVTIITYQRTNIFGQIENGQINLNLFGKIVQHHWTQIPLHFPNAVIDQFCIMPNHIHGIIHLSEKTNQTPTRQIPKKIIQKHYDNENIPLPTGTTPNSLNAIIQNFKSVTTRKINGIRHLHGERVWHRNYWEQVIQDEKSYLNIADYIQNNSIQWNADQYYRKQIP